MAASAAPDRRSLLIGGTVGEFIHCAPSSCSQRSGTARPIATQPHPLTPPSGLAAAISAPAPPARAAEGVYGPRGVETSMDALEGRGYGKSRIDAGPDFVTTDTGLQYKDFVVGDESSPAPRVGDTVVLDWTGVTLGYYGRPFEAKSKVKGSAFNDDTKEYFRFVLDPANTRVIPAVQEAVATMRPGGIRRIVVPNELSYPNGDFKTWGPTPSTFSGERALGFVVEAKNSMIDKTLQFDLKLVRIDRK